MLFNSFAFLGFFGVIYALYRFLPHRGQNLWLVCASLFFYGAWDQRLLLLLIASCALNFICVREMAARTQPEEKKIYLRISLFLNLGILFLFKYFHFFFDSLQSLLRVFGWDIPNAPFQILLPIGISFYTFQKISYAVDVYRGLYPPVRSFSDFVLYSTFFPQLIAGPIERPAHLMPQILRPRPIHLEGFQEGCLLFFWGLYEKVFIADNLAPVVARVFDQPGPHTGPAVLLAIYAYAFQILCDFDGYSNMARGLGKLLGFDLMANFNLPYFALGPCDFWRRWHISLSTWLRDYLYIPLGGNREGTWFTLRNLFLTMLLGGLWHGARWNFVLWGFYHGVLLMLAHFYHSTQAAERIEPLISGKARNCLRIFIFFHLTCLGWLFFRASSLSQCWELLNSLFANFHFQIAEIRPMLAALVRYAGLFIVLQCWGYTRHDPFVFRRLPEAFRGLFYAVLFYSLILCGTQNNAAFIYFQF